MIALKFFQHEAVRNAVGVFDYARELLNEAETTEDVQRITSHNGAILLQAPTGAGKTLMAGRIAEEMSVHDRVVWFWFAPFAGLVTQSEAAIRDLFPRLRVQNLATDRHVEQSKTGDVYVATWGSVATDNKDTRRVRKKSETAPSLDGFLEQLRTLNFRIGVVVDEAHHGFSAGTKALDFYAQVLKPEYSLFVTATPDDEDAENFRRRAGIRHLHRISISRHDALEARLIKRGIRSIAYLSTEHMKPLVDFEMAALRDGVEIHNRIKSSLQEAQVSLTPLMMVQVDSDAGVERAKEHLQTLGIHPDAISVHTAKEPDANLLALAVDETKEVLIFKMAVALGFDAPRAFVLVSMRGSKDADFGTQIVGRILRVHGRLQSQTELPEILQYGYVVLADSERQAGLQEAGRKINALQTEFSDLSPYTMVVRIGEEKRIQIVQNGQTSFMPFFGANEPEPPLVLEPQELATNEEPSGQFTLVDIMTGSKAALKKSSTASPPLIPVQRNGYRYALRADVPHRLWTQKPPLPNDNLIDAIVNRIPLDGDVLSDARRKSTDLVRQEQSIFDANDIKRERRRGELAMNEVERKAQQLLLKLEYISPRDVQEALLKRLKLEFEARGDTDMADNEDALECALSLILVLHPRLLPEAQREVMAQYAEVNEAESLPEEIFSDEELPTSHHNAYGIIPPGLNRWEKDFVTQLDNDTEGIILWWHRNPPLKHYSVNVVLPTGEGFYPDFVIGVKGRNNCHQILLVDTKGQINEPKAQLEANSQHPVYGRVMLTYWENETQWMTLCYDPITGRNVPDRRFRLALLATF